MKTRQKQSASKKRTSRKSNVRKATPHWYKILDDCMNSVGLCFQKIEAIDDDEEKKAARDALRYTLGEVFAMIPKELADRALNVAEQASELNRKTVGEVRWWQTHSQDVTTELREQIRQKNAWWREAERRQAVAELPINLERGRVYVQGKEVALELTKDRREDAICFLRHLAEKRGNWISSSEIVEDEKRASGRDMTGIRWDRILRDLPTTVQNHINSSPKKGYRIKPSA